MIKSNINSKDYFNKKKQGEKNYWEKKTNLILWHKKPKKLIHDKLFFDDGRVNIAYNCIKANIDKGLKN